VVLGAKIERVSCVWAGNLTFFISRGGQAGHVPLHADWTLGTGQDVGAHTGAGGECAEAIEADVGADGLAQPPFPHTRLLRTASRGNPDLIATFLVEYKYVFIYSYKILHTNLKKHKI